MGVLTFVDTLFYLKVFVKKITIIIFSLKLILENKVIYINKLYNKEKYGEYNFLQD